MTWYGARLDGLALEGLFLKYPPYAFAGASSLTKRNRYAQIRVRTGQPKVMHYRLATGWFGDEIRAVHETFLMYGTLPRMTRKQTDKGELATVWLPASSVTLRTELVAHAINYLKRRQGINLSTRFKEQYDVLVQRAHYGEEKEGPTMTDLARELPFDLMVQDGKRIEMPADVQETKEGDKTVKNSVTRNYSQLLGGAQYYGFLRQPMDDDADDRRRLVREKAKELGLKTTTLRYNGRGGYTVTFVAVADLDNAKLKKLISEVSTGLKASPTDDTFTLPAKQKAA